MSKVRIFAGFSKERLVEKKNRNWLRFLLSFYSPRMYRAFSSIKEKAYAWKGTGGEYNINLSSGNPSTLVSGRSGAGKTTLVKHLVKGLVDSGRIPVILDFHGEFSFINELGGRDYSPSNVSISLWDLDGKSPKDRVKETSSSLTNILGLGALQSYYLEKSALKAFQKKGVLEKDEKTWSLKAPSMSEVIQACEELSLEEKKESIFTLRARLVSLAGEKMFGNETLFSFKEVIKQPSRVMLSHASSDKGAAVFVESFLSKLYSHMLSKGLTNQEPKVFIVIR